MKKFLLLLLLSAVGSAGFVLTAMPLHAIPLPAAAEQRAGQEGPTLSTGDSIQAAINALPPSGGKVTIPAGTYNLSSEILVATAGGGKYEICGTGPATVLNITGSNKAIHVTGRPGSTLSHFKLCDMTIQSSSPGSAPALVHLDGIAMFSVQDVTLLMNGKATYGYQLTAAQQGEIHGGAIIQSGSGVGVREEMSASKVASNGVEIHGISFNGGGGSSIGIQQDGTDSSFVHSNHFVAYGVVIDVPAGGYGPTTVQDNHLELFSIAGVRSAAYIRVLNNNFFSKGPGPDVLLTGSEYSIISGNLIQSGISIARSAIGAVVSHNQVNMTASLSDSGSQSIWSENRGLGCKGLCASSMRSAEGLRHKRTEIGLIPSGSSASVRVLWDAPFADTNYTFSCTVLEATAGLTLRAITSQSPGGLVVNVNNTTSVALAGRVNCIAQHD